MRGSEEVEDALFQVPEELVCPITHAVFRNPVITAVGTVYEERAIRQHLQHNQTDPLTNQKIEDAKLTPVFVLRSKAKQYATSTAARCLDRVLDPECHDPATYLRRACDVCEEADVLDSVPQLSANIVDFAQQHRGAMHDVFLLINFATGLAIAGDTAAALALFANLLRLEPDRPVQTAVIKRCLLHCWQPPDATAAAAATASTPPAAAAAAAVAAAAAAAASPPQLRCDVAAVLRFIAAQAGLRAADFVAVLEDLGVPRKDLITICQGLLSDAHADPASSSSPTSQPPLDRPNSSSAIAPSTDATPAPATAPGLPTPRSSVMGSRSASRDLSTGMKGRQGVSFAERGVSHDQYPPAGTTAGAGTGAAAHAQIRRASSSAGGAAGAEVVVLDAVTDLQATCAQLQEAMAVVPKLLALVEAEVRAESAEKFALLEQEVGIAEPAEGEDGESVAAAAAAGGEGASGGAAWRGRAWAVGAVVGGTLVPGILGRVALAGPVIALLLKR